MNTGISSHQFGLEPLAKIDRSISRHSVRVSQLCEIIGLSLGFAEKELELIQTIGLLHDIGKTTLPKSILDKPSTLTPREYQLVQCHAATGANILAAAGYSDHIINGVRNHHERLDGSGYPNGLKAEQLCLMSKVITVADVYEAMTSDRPYRRALSPAVALDELRNGDKYDQEVTKALISGLSCPEWIMDQQLVD